MEDVEGFFQSIEAMPPPRTHKDSKKVVAPSTGKRRSRKISTSSVTGAIGFHGVTGGMYVRDRKYINTRCELFGFPGKEYRPGTWRELLGKVAEEIYRAHSADFERCLSLHGKKQLYFSKKPNELKNPENNSRLGILL